MAKILDQYGKPLSTADIAEPQTARLGHLVSRFLEPALNGLTPARLAAALRDADQGDLLGQHRLFADMEDRDTHLAGEMDKRKNALTGIDWEIVPPRNATAAEEDAAVWVKEVLQDAVDPLEDLIVFLMEGVGHGFACAELEWRRDGLEWLPIYHPRPQEWFRLDPTRTQLRISDASVEGLPMQSFGWVWHTPGKPKTGYAGRMGLYRPLCWPFLYKAYGIGDFAEFLETYGLPIILGKYFSGASADEKASLLRAVTQLGHDARAIMPKEMELEIQKITGGGDATPHLAMVDWADKAMSKLILGGTLTSQADGKTSTNALGNVHNEVRHDILKSDARRIAGTLTRDLVYPLIALNRGGVDSLRRCPRLVFDTAESEDIAMLADALPKLSPVMRIPSAWAYGKLRIPVPQEGEEVLGAAVPADSGKKEPPPVTGLAALSAEVGVGAGAKLDPLAAEADQLTASASAHWETLLGGIKKLVDETGDLAALQGALVTAYGGMDTRELTQLMAAAFALAELKGMATVRQEAS